MSRTQTAVSYQDRSLIDLTRLLSRLERNLLAADIDPSLKQSSYQRARVSANIEYAHNLILSIEHANHTAKAQNQKSKVQADLQQKRLLLKKLQDRLYDLGQQDEESLDDSYLEDTEAEDLLSTYAPANVLTPKINEEEDDHRLPDHSQELGQMGTSNLRSRRGLADERKDGGATSGAAVGEGSSASAPGSSTMPFAPKPIATTTEGDVLLRHHSAAQETLTSSLLELAKNLKTSTQSFSDALSSSDPLVDRATVSLDKNVSGMEGAERRMGMLRRMTEGRGWWARLSLYGWIAVLWVALILIMFIMPKLRF